LTMHCKVCAVVQMTCSSRRHHSVATGGDGVTGVRGDENFRRLACGVCLVKHL